MPHHFILTHHLETKPEGIKRQYENWNNTSHWCPQRISTSICNWTWHHNCIRCPFFRSALLILLTQFASLLYWMTGKTKLDRISLRLTNLSVSQTVYQTEMRRGNYFLSVSTQLRFYYHPNLITGLGINRMYVTLSNTKYELFSGDQSTWCYWHLINVCI